MIDKTKDLGWAAGLEPADFSTLTGGSGSEKRWIRCYNVNVALLVSTFWPLPSWWWRAAANKADPQWRHDFYLQRHSSTGVCGRRPLLLLAELHWHWSEHCSSAHAVPASPQSMQHSLKRRKTKLFPTSVWNSGRSDPVPQWRWSIRHEAIHLQPGQQEATLFSWWNLSAERFCCDTFIWVLNESPQILFWRCRWLNPGRRWLRSDCTV